MINYYTILNPDHTADILRYAAVADNHCTVIQDQHQIVIAVGCDTWGAHAPYINDFLQQHAAQVQGLTHENK